MGILDAPGLSQGKVKQVVKRRDLSPSRLLSRQVAATAPTVAVTGTSLVGVGNTQTPQYNAVTSGAVTLTGGAGWAHPTNGWSTASYWRTDRAQDTNGMTTGPQKIMFHCDAALVEVSHYWPASTSYRIKVDDQYLTLSGTAVSGGFSRFLTMDFTAAGGAKPRRLVIETTGLPIGVNTTATGTVWPAIPRGPRVFFFGDSYTGGSSGNDSSYTTWHSMLSDLLGWEDVYNNAIGSTGYVATVGGYANAALDQVNAAISAGVTPDIVIGTWGHNDIVSTATMAAQAATVYQRIRSAWPNAFVICGGPWYVGGAAQVSTWAAKETAIFNAVGTLADGFIPQSTGSSVPWFTGTGKAGTTTGSGNSDLYVYSDGIHPTQAGHDYAGFRMAAAIRTLLGT